jgi:hypothetical protein
MVSLGMLLGYWSAVRAQDSKWSWEVHRYVNDKAVDYLPAEMAFFKEERDYLSAHSADPDGDENPSYYHYIDIDVYPEFFQGTLPHAWTDMLNLYNYYTVTDNGIVPWVIEWWTDSLAVLMSARNWEGAWQIAAELGHYVADSHQPLHLTANYDGQETGNRGIHSRYETQMVKPYLSQMPDPEGSSSYWANVPDSVFQYIEDIYPAVDAIMYADDLASSVDPNYGTLYYTLLWSELDSLTISVLQRSILDLASLWYTAWLNAGQPVPGEDPQRIEWDSETIPQHLQLMQNFPNPFNAQTRIAYWLEQPAQVMLTIYNLAGELVEILVDEYQSPVNQVIYWDASRQPSGEYFYQLEAAGLRQVRKCILLR